MVSAASSTILTTLSLLAICLAVLLLLRHYLPLRTTPAFLTVPIFLALALPASAVLLVPIDLASSSGPEDEAHKGIWLAQRPLLVAWRLAYWLTFMLTWFILPLLAEYMDAGYRDPMDRLIYSLRSNGRYQLIMLSCAVLGLVYISFDYSFNFTAIKGLLMALAYVWGLMLAIYLAGHGMVAVPRNLLRKASTAGSLKRVQTQAVRVNEKLDDAVVDLEELEAQVLQLKQRKTGTARDFQEWIDELADMLSTQESRILANPATIGASAKLPAVITDRYLADLTRRLERATMRKTRYTQEWDAIVQKATDLQAILDSTASKKLTFGRGKSILTPSLRYFLYVQILPYFYFATGGILALASIAVVTSEIIRFPASQLSPVSLTVVHHPNNDDYQVGFGGQFIAAGWIAYMCICALSSINDVPVWNGRALVRRNTHPESACWYAGQVAKLTVPLTYNFLTFTPKAVYQKTVFYNFLGKLVNLTHLGVWFDYLFPMFILIPVCATLFNLYGRIKRVFGFGIMDDDEEDSAFGATWRDGRDLIARDLRGPSNFGIRDPPEQQTAAASSTRWGPSTGGQAATTTRASRAMPPPLDPEPEEENFFTLFGRRVKNTMDGIETPKWMKQGAKVYNGRSGWAVMREASHRTRTLREDFWASLVREEVVGVVAGMGR
ncbi:LIMR family protein [Cyphellophora attinorum]|uniref:LIMR family protein n=1 Tax=Cyphellophora attinorum TaxID=1664694 RepID=A0A0N0NJF9_9EURO|nr:LIMR family protein [Phialophora attinorum]KPI36858.1 LIMR family protein [Phialophora attinorum]